MFVGALVVVGWVTCGVTAPAQTSDAERLALSLTKWLKAKEACGGNYAYKVVRSSFTGYQSVTTVVVKANQVVERRLETATPTKPGESAPLKVQWMERGKDIGTHKDAAEPRTLDELYALAKKIVEAEVPADHVRRLGFDKDGLLQYCFLQNTRIQDDAPQAGVASIQLMLGKK